MKNSPPLSQNTFTKHNYLFPRFFEIKTKQYLYFSCPLELRTIAVAGLCNCAQLLSPVMGIVHNCCRRSLQLCTIAVAGHGNCAQLPVPGLCNCAQLPSPVMAIVHNWSHFRTNIRSSDRLISPGVKALHCVTFKNFQIMMSYVNGP